MNKKYQIIYADPPYPIRWVTVPTKSGFKGLDYPTMGIAEMCNLPVKDISEECSKCFVWTTNHFLLEGLFLIRSWGFQFDKLWVWCKKTGFNNYNWKGLTLGALLAIRAGLIKHDTTLAREIVQWLDNNCPDLKEVK